MGGFAGHMMHLNDNPNLTFGQMKDVFTKAASGELIGTEKTDGQNLFVSYSVKKKQARAVRNSGEIKSGGLDPAGLADKFADRGDLTATFVEGFDAFEKAVQSLPIEEQLAIFGPDANNFYNSEIMNPGVKDPETGEKEGGTANVIDYDTKSLVIHRVGHHQLDKMNRTTTPLKDEELVRKLETALESIQQDEAADKYTVQVNAIRNLHALSDDKPLKHTLARLDSFMSENGLSDSDTIGDYIIKTVSQNIDNELPNVSQELRNMILVKILGQQKAATITQIEKKYIEDLGEGSDEGDWSKIKDMIDQKNFHFKWIMYPLEDIVHDFAVEMLRGLESAFILDNKEEVRRLKDEVALAKKMIEDSGNEGAIEILKKQMKKLKDVENVSTATEGFVFDYDGNTYKFTGGFAPVNQLLGLFKYGRGDIPPLKIDEEVEAPVEAPKDADLALIPGSFKPPHKGHLSLASEYSKLADKVIILISNPQNPKSLRTLPESGEIIVPQMSKEIWETYLDKSGISNAEVLVSPSPSPVGSVFDFLDHLAQHENEVDVILGTSTKGGDDLEKYADIGKYQGTNVKVRTVPLPPVEEDGEELHASDMRAAIDDMDSEFLEMKFLPPGVSGGEIINIIKSQTPILEPEAELEEISAMGSSVGGAAVSGYSGDRKKKPVLFKREGMIKREDIMFEIKLRELVQKRIKSRLQENKQRGVIMINESQRDMLNEHHEEYALRKCIRKLILQEKTEPTPHSNTGINQLTDLLKKIVPILSVGFKSLTTAQEQRTSYRSHIINAVINALAPAQAEDKIDDNEGVDELEEVDINIDDEAEGDQAKFIDIDPAPPEEEEEESFQTLSGQDLTGRNVALKDFDRIERIILDSYDVLGNDKDQDLFYDYLLTNLKLYFDKFEGELVAIESEPTTDEYEAEKSTEEELPEETPEELDGGEEEEVTLQEVESEKQRDWARWQRGLDKDDPEKKLTNDEADEFIAAPAHK